jgi:2-polyprenyl-6-hydroxyphenyl methylase/3-demethylubiquinone-9 3-methyltransferase
MTAAMKPVSPTHAPCKCCGTTASLYGVVDFHKNCNVQGRRSLDVSGIPVYYHRCPACRFIFTTAFDQFTISEFNEHIYNDLYAQLDPEYEDIRPRANAAALTQLLSAAKPSRMLDYGGGNGKLAALLRAAGFPQTESYDPFVSGSTTRPEGKFDFISCFEVVEHTTDPVRTFADINSFLADPGVIFFSTLIQPADIDAQGVNWWYALPRNGHVSLYTRASLEWILRPLGLNLASFNDNLHVLFRQVPDWARHFIRIG